MLGNSGQQIVGFLVFVYLARILSPAEFGMMALAAALIDLLTVFGRFGQVEALMQKGNVDEAPCSTSFWLIFAIGAGLLLFVLAVAEPFAAIFGEPEVAILLVALAPVPLLQNLGQVHEAFMRGAFDYRGIAARNSGATLVSGIASVLAAMADYGVYALVVQKLVFALTYSTLVWLSWHWRPRLEFRLDDARQLIRIGFDVVVANLLYMLNSRIVDAAVGFFLGVATLGYLRIAWRLFDLAQQLIVQPVSAVAISSLTQLSNSRPALARSFLRYLGTLSLIAIPALAGIGFLADDVIRLAAGAQWGPSAPMLTILATSAAALPVNFLFPSAMLAVGCTATIRRMALLQIVATAASMAIAAQYGIFAVLMVHVVRVYLFAAVNIYVLHRALDVRLAAIVGCLVPPVFSATAMMVFILWLQLDGLPGLYPLAGILLLGFTGALAYGTALFAGGLTGIWRTYLQDMTDLARDAARLATERLAGK
jgi:O-antigen/teichoic acid export membrane protein